MFWLFLFNVQQKGLYPLHVAAGLTGPEGPKITELLLHAVAAPDVKAQDASEVYILDKVRLHDNTKTVAFSLLLFKEPDMWMSGLCPFFIER